MKGLKILLIGILLFTFSGGALAQSKKKKRPRIVKTPTTSTTTVSNTNTNNTQTASNTNLSDTEITGGLKEALFSGVKFAVNTLGRDNGFLDDARVKIPLPQKLQNVEKVLRLAGQGKVVDDFVASMNHAAEKAVPVAIEVFLDSIKQMTFNDVRKILFSGQDDSATQFFRRTSEETLRGKFRPIVEKFTNEVGVTQKYKDMMGKYGFVGKLFGQDASDIDGYVTQKALDGLFFMVAEEEKKIRKDPIGTGSAILKKVFGAIFK
ncbi:MAG: DUF4197 domain-containing protein [Pyrinomonadaceae bacterium]|nr:DUF4197 domain-containing protein [Pyrinomonadaceae bacterium]